MPIEDDPFLGEILDTPEKRARWLYRLKVAYIVWILFVVIGILFIMLFYVLQ